jgi:hypothetical protein
MNNLHSNRLKKYSNDFYHNVRVHLQGSDHHHKLKRFK